MQPEATFEQRLSAVEAAVAAIRQQIGANPPAANWIQRLSGAFKDEPAFEEVIAYGKAIRATGQLPEDAEP